MGVSENGGTPKSSILIGISIINRPFWGTPMFGNIHMYIHGISTSNHHHHFLLSGAAKVKVEKVERPVMGPKPPGGDMNSVRFGVGCFFFFFFGGGGDGGGLGWFNDCL